MPEIQTQTIGKSNLSETALKVMPYMEKLSMKFRMRGLIEIANKLIRQELLNEVFNPQDKKDFNMVVADIRKQMMEEYKNDEEGKNIIENYLNEVERIA